MVATHLLFVKRSHVLLLCIELLQLLLVATIAQSVAEHSHLLRRVTSTQHLLAAVMLRVGTASERGLRRLRSLLDVNLSGSCANRLLLLAREVVHRAATSAMAQRLMMIFFVILTDIVDIALVVSVMQVCLRLGDLFLKSRSHLLLLLEGLLGHLLHVTRWSGCRVVLRLVLRKEDGLVPLLFFVATAGQVAFLVLLC